MQAPRTLAAAFLSAAILLTGATAFADKGGHHSGGHASGAAAGGENNDNDHGSSSERSGGRGATGIPGGAVMSHEMGDHQGSSRGMHRQSADGEDESGRRSMHSGMRMQEENDSEFRFHGSLSGMDQRAAKLEIKTRDGNSRQFDADTAVLNHLKMNHDNSNMVFFSVDGKRITSCAKIGETDRAKVTGMNNGSIIIQTANGESRLLVMDQKSIQRLHLHEGSDVSVTTGGPQGGRIVSEEMLKKHWSDKFSAKGASNCGGCRETAARHQSENDNESRLAVNAAHKCNGGNNGDRESADKGGKCRAGGDVDKDHVKVGDVDVTHKCNGGNNGDRESADKGGKCRAGADVDKDRTKVAGDFDVSHKCNGGNNGDRESADKGGKCRAGGDVDKDHVKVGDVDVTHKCNGGNNNDRDHADKGGKCRAGGDVDKDHVKVGDVDVTHKCNGGNNSDRDHAKGGKCHGSASTPPGSSTTVAVQPAVNTPNGGGNAVHGGSAPGAGSTPVGGPNTVVANTPNVGNRTPGIGYNGPSMGTGMAPIVHNATPRGSAPAGTSATPGAAGGPVAMSGTPARHPTRVMGAAVGPTAGQIRLVRPMANTPCVWRKTTVAAATYHRYRVVGTSYSPSHRPMHRTACH